MPEMSEQFGKKIKAGHEDLEELEEELSALKERKRLLKSTSTGAATSDFLRIGQDIKLCEELISAKEHRIADLERNVRNHQATVKKLALKERELSALRTKAQRILKNQLVEDFVLGMPPSEFARAPRRWGDSRVLKFNFFDHGPGDIQLLDPIVLFPPFLQMLNSLGSAKPVATLPNEQQISQKVNEFVNQLGSRIWSVEADLRQELYDFFTEVFPNYRVLCEAPSPDNADQGRAFIRFLVELRRLGDGRIGL